MNRKNDLSPMTTLPVPEQVMCGALKSPTSGAMSPGLTLIEHLPTVPLLCPLSATRGNGSNGKAGSSRMRPNVFV